MKNRGHCRRFHQVKASARMGWGFLFVMDFTRSPPSGFIQISCLKDLGDESDFTIKSGEHC